MAERRPIVLVNGETRELPSGDTLGGDLPIIRRVLSGAVSDDGIVNITTPWKGGTAFVSCFTTNTYENGDGKVNSHSGILNFDTGSSPQLSAFGTPGTFFAALNSVPTGTTGTDGYTNVGRDTDKLVIENRAGGTRYYSVTFLP